MVMIGRGKRRCPMFARRLPLVRRLFPNDPARLKQSCLVFIRFTRNPLYVALTVVLRNCRTPMLRNNCPLPFVNVTKVRLAT